jgi:hypothetical protein
MVPFSSEKTGLTSELSGDFVDETVERMRSMAAPTPKEHDRPYGEALSSGVDDRIVSS